MEISCPTDSFLKAIPLCKDYIQLVTHIHAHYVTVKQLQISFNLEVKAVSFLGSLGSSADCVIFSRSCSPEACSSIKGDNGTYRSSVKSFKVYGCQQCKEQRTTITTTKEV